MFSLNASSQKNQNFEEIVKVLDCIDSVIINDFETPIVIIVEDSIYSTSVKKTTFYVNDTIVFLLVSKSEIFMRNYLNYYIVSKYILTQDVYYLKLTLNKYADIKKNMNIVFEGYVK
jgi:hypothetical protein